METLEQVKMGWWSERVVRVGPVSDAVVQVVAVVVGGSRGGRERSPGIRILRSSPFHLDFLSERT